MRMDSRLELHTLINMVTEPDNYEMLIAFLMGVGLSAACGFRVFVPLLIASLAIRSGVIPPEQLDANLQWLGSQTALIVLMTATVVEIIAYYVPWVDNILDAVSTPVAIVAGTLITFAFSPEMSPMLKWGLAALIGGGSAATLQSSTAVARGGSTVTTAGLANPILSTIELIAAIVLSLLAIFVPLFCAFVVLALLVLCFRIIFRVLRGKRGRVEAT